MVHCVIIAHSNDSVIRLWNLEKVLLCDIHLGEELSSCNFLNGHGDLIIGWKRHLFVIDRKTMSLQGFANEELSDNCEKESAIYEDPSIRYESTFAKKSKKPSVITMKNYLVPYGFVETESNEAMDLKLNFVEKAESEQSEGSEVSLCANTNTYLSPAMSMESFGIIDALFPRKSSVNKIQNKTDMMLPKFGISPGSTPAESIASVTEDSIFVDEDKEEYLNIIDAIEDGIPHLQTKDRTVDLKEKLSVGAVVAKAILKMSKKRQPPKEEQPTSTEIKSRFAGTRLDSRNLMKKGMNVVFAVESLQKEKRSAASHSEKSQMKQFTKKTRRPSTAGSRRKSLVPTEIPLQPLKVQDDGSAGDSDSFSENHELDKKDLEVKLEELGRKMTPQSKVDEYSSNLPQLGKFTPSQQRKKHSAHYRGSAKPNLHLSNKLKRKAKSATLARTRSSFGKHETQIKLTSSAEKGSKSSKNSAAAWLSQISKDQSRNIATIEGAKTSSGMPDEKTNETTESMKPNELMVDANEERKVNFVENKLQMRNESGEHFVTSLENAAKALNQAESKLCDEDERRYKAFLHFNKNKDGDDSADEDELTIPNLLEIDFHAIYKKDGLQFDEKWQDRMLERYLLLKLQKEQRHEAAMNKRIYLEQERHFRLIASQPDLIQKYNEPWYENPNLLANCILNSKLMKGEVSSSPDMLFHENRPDSQLSRRPKSVASKYNDNENFEDEEEKTYRFSIRSKSCDIDEHVGMLSRRSRHSDRYLTPAPSTSSTSIRSKNLTTLQQKFVADRPRSSTSIPGKTRYILIKPEHEKKSGKTVSPTKLEETLLRKRFPSQHLCVMRSLGRLDEMRLSDVEDNKTLEEIQPHHDRPYSKGSTSSEFRKIHTAPSNDYNGLWNNAHKSETDAYLMDIKSREIGHSERSHRHPWKSVTSDSCINPLDIVKRKSSCDPSMKFAVKSVNA